MKCKVRDSGSRCLVCLRPPVVVVVLEGESVFLCLRHSRRFSHDCRSIGGVVEDLWVQGWKGK